jgi:hypothetical protein
VAAGAKARTATRLLIASSNATSAAAEERVAAAGEAEGERDGNIGASLFPPSLISKEKRRSGEATRRRTKGSGAEEQGERKAALCLERIEEALLRWRFCGAVARGVVTQLAPNRAQTILILFESRVLSHASFEVARGNFVNPRYYVILHGEIVVVQFWQGSTLATYFSVPFNSKVPILQTTIGKEVQVPNIGGKNDANCIPPH